MFNINDVADIHDGVTLVFCRHDDALGQNITATGAAWAYALGKFMSPCFKIKAPEYIIHSPISRARNTAKMHQIGMKVNNISNPTMKYDARLHEQASLEASKEAVVEAINEVKFLGVKTIEVVTHSNGPVDLARAFGGHPKDGDLGYGGIVAVKADSWADMLAGRIKECESYKTSKDAVETVMGKDQRLVLDYMFTLYSKGSVDNSKIFQEASEELRGSCWGLEGIFSCMQKKNEKWEEDVAAGKDVETIVPPIEFAEIFDAYKFWVQNLMISVGLDPEKIPQLRSELSKELLGTSVRTFSERFFINEPEDPMSYAYPILNAAMKKEEAKRGIDMSAREAGNQVVADMLDDFPGYRDSMLVGQAKVLLGDEEKAAEPHEKASYYVKDGDEGESHVMLNMMAWKMLKEKAQGKN